jgi:hypothetical protein
MAGFFETIEVILPLLLILGAEFVQVFPGIDTGIVLIIEHELQGVIALRLDRIDGDLFLVNLKHFLTRAVTGHLCGRRIHTKVLTGQVEYGAVVIFELEYTAFLMQVDIYRSHGIGLMA